MLTNDQMVTNDQADTIQIFEATRDSGFFDKDLRAQDFLSQWLTNQGVTADDVEKLQSGNFGLEDTTRINELLNILSDYEGSSDASETWAQRKSSADDELIQGYLEILRSESDRLGDLEVDIANSFAAPSTGFGGAGFADLFSAEELLDPGQFSSVVTTPSYAALLDDDEDEIADVKGLSSGVKSAYGG